MKERKRARNAYGEDDQNDHQSSLGDGGGRSALVSSEEEESTKADLSDVHSDEDVGDGLGEEESSGVERSILVVDPGEEVWVEGRREIAIQQVARSTRRVEKVRKGSSHISTTRRARRRRSRRAR